MVLQSNQMLMLSLDPYARVSDDPPIGMMYLGASSWVYHRRYIFIFPLITPANVLMFYFVMNFINPTE